MVALRARRKEVPDCVPAPFEAHTSCEDSTFNEYMARKEEQCEDNSIVALDNATLMNIALEKYKTLCDKKAWKTKTKGELEFIAMKAELEQTKKKLSQRPPRQQQRKPFQPNQERTGPLNDGDWAWKSIAPLEGEPHTKKFCGKECICCPHHGETKWVLKIGRRGVEHTTGCRAMANQIKQEAIALQSTATTPTKSTTDSAASAGSKTPSKSDAAWAKALTTVIEDNVSEITHEENL